MTLRPQADDEAALRRLAATWRMSLQQAALRAIRERAAQVEAEDDVLGISDQLAEQDAEALDRLGTL